MFGFKYVYPNGVPNGSGWQAKARIDGKLVLFGTGDTPEQAAALLPASLRTKPAACEARGVKRKAPASPVDMCEHVAQGSEEGSLSAEIRAVGKQDPYRPPFSPLRLDTTSARVPAARATQHQATLSGPAYWRHRRPVVVCGPRSELADAALVGRCKPSEPVPRDIYKPVFFNTTRHAYCTCC